MDQGNGKFGAFGFRSRWLVLFVALATVCLTGCGPAAHSEPAPSIQATVDAAMAAALAPVPTPQARTSDLAPRADGQVPLLISDKRTDIPRYDRDEWNHWTDDDGDCQNARHEVLIAESLSAVEFRSSADCLVDSGQWLAPFTGTAVTDAGSLDVDHLVPLANAHSSGGWAWSNEQKSLYANDLQYPGHLLAVTAFANRSKGARGPEEWRPPDKRYWCAYATDWVVIKITWQLTATASEWSALQEMLSSCETLPFEIVAVETLSALAPTATAVSPPAAGPLPSDPNGPDRDCGDFPDWRTAQDFYVTAGAPANDPHRLDGDSDGVACESLSGAP